MELKIKINKINLLIMKYCVFLIFFIIQLEANENKKTKILNFLNYYDEKSINNAFSSIHFCYWEYFNNEILNTNSITKIIYLDNPIKSNNQSKSIMDDFLNNEDKNLTNKELIFKCKDAGFCAYFEVFKKIKIKLFIYLD
jgi:hypothetical protein